MVQRVSYLGSSGDARESSSQEYSPAQDPAQNVWCLGNSPRLHPGLLFFRCVGVSLFWRSTLGGP